MVWAMKNKGLVLCLTAIIMNNAVNINIKAKEFESLSSPMVLDLLAFFKLLEEDIYKIIDKADKVEWTPEKLIKEIETLI